MCSGRFRLSVSGRFSFGKGKETKGKERVRKHLFFKKLDKNNLS
jgi:hypothetical protein